MAVNVLKYLLSLKKKKEKMTTSLITRKIIHVVTANDTKPMTMTMTVMTSRPTDDDIADYKEDIIHVSEDHNNDDDANNGAGGKCRR